MNNREMNNRDTYREASSSITRSHVLCSHLARGLHAAAQPLTILMASLSNSHTEGMSADELRELTASSAMEVQRVASLFSGLQQLVLAESMSPYISETPLLPLLSRVLDGVQLLFGNDKMLLKSRWPEICHPVLINPTRTHQALSNVLLVAHGLSISEDTIELLVATTGRGVEIVIQNAHALCAVLNTEASLGMALAEANIRSQQGTFAWRLQPFWVQIELRRAAFLQ